MQQKQILIEFRHIFLTFKKKKIFDDFNLKIYSQDKIVIIGQSGIGKSTLFSILLGIQEFQAGEIFFKSKKVTAKNIHNLRRQIAYVDQDLTIGNGLVKDAIADYFNFAVNKSIKIDKNELNRLLLEFSLELNILDQDIDQLSGGEKQRLSLVIALLLKRPILLLDEISSSLDSKLAEQLMIKILNQTNKTIILIAHDQRWQKQKNILIFNFKDKQWKQ